MAASTSSKKTYIVSIPGQSDREVSAERVEFIAGQNRVTFFSGDNPVSSFSGSGISFYEK